MIGASVLSVLEEAGEQEMRQRLRNLRSDFLQDNQCVSGEMMHLHGNWFESTIWFILCSGHDVITWGNFPNIYWFNRIPLTWSVFMSGNITQPIFTKWFAACVWSIIFELCRIWRNEICPSVGNKHSVSLFFVIAFAWPNSILKRWIVSMVIASYAIQVYTRLIDWCLWCELMNLLV